MKNAARARRRSVGDARCLPTSPSTVTGRARLQDATAATTTKNDSEKQTLLPGQQFRVQAVVLQRRVEHVLELRVRLGQIPERPQH